MQNAKFGYVLGNGLMVMAEDMIKITTNDGEIGVGRIIDIGQSGVTISLLTESGDMDVYFKDVESISKIS